jgi:D-sedoheptulose 7-phosphate isomerase
MTIESRAAAGAEAYESMMRQHLADAIAVKRRMLEQSLPDLVRLTERLHDILAQGGTIYLCGNGGSAADCQHVAAEFVGRFRRERRPLPAVALTTNTSTLTAIGNDYSFESVFSRQVQAAVTANDAVIGISTSGRSPNVLAAITEAHAKGAATIAFTGMPGEPLASLANHVFRAPSADTPRIQECHILAWHMVCDGIEQFFGSHTP